MQSQSIGIEPIRLRCKASRSSGVGRWAARLPATLLALTALVGCGGGDEGGGGGDDEGGGLTEDPSTDASTFDVEWREDAVIVDDVTAVQQALVRMDYAAGTLVFDPGFSGLAQLSVGNAALIGGVGIFRILDRQETAEGVELSVEDAALTDVIADGTIAFRKSFLSVPDADKIGLGEGEDETTLIRSLRQPLSIADGLSYSGTVGGLQVDFSLTPRGDRTLDMKLDGKYGSGAARFNANLTGQLRGLTTDVSIQIEASSLTAYRIETSQIDGEVAVQADATALGSIGQTIQVPARVALPIVLGGIPFHIDIGGAIEVASTLTTRATAQFKGKAKFQGAVGLDISRGQVSVNDTTLQSEMSFDDATLSSDVTAGLRVTLVFPEVAVGVGMQQALSANGFVRFKTETVSNLVIQERNAVLLPVPITSTETRYCLEGSVSVGATYGGNATFLGVTLAEAEVPLATLFGETSRSGEACEDVE